MKLLIKFPTKNRSEKFREVLLRYINHLSGEHEVRFMINVDSDDILSYEMAENLQEQFEGIDVRHAPNKSKIQAINQGLDDYDWDWDIVLLASDDMIPIKNKYDKIIIEKMRNHYPDTDGVLWFNDGYVGNKLNTLSILGRKYYDRFGYIYHPSYTSLWCDNESMTVANLLGKQTYFNEVIIKHDHPNNTRGQGMDAQYKKTESYYHIDKKVFEERRKKTFDLEIINTNTNS